MSNGARFLSVMDTYAGYCQICNEPKMVGRIAVAGWPFSGSVCSGCLSQLADELERRANATSAAATGNGSVLAAGAGSNGKVPHTGARGNGNGGLV